MKSNWEESKKRSRYHFDSQRRDQAHEVIEHLGRLDPVWLDDIDEIVANSAERSTQQHHYRKRERNGQRCTTSLCAWLCIYASS
jgi:hypothetical protein